MATLFSDLIPIVRNRLIEPTPKFWSDAELIQIMITGVRDLWRDIVDLKQEHYLTIDNTNVSLVANATTLTGVPADVHKVYLISPRTPATDRLIFKPLDYNDETFQSALARDAMEPSNGIIYYAIHQQGAPVGPPTILTAPKVTATVLISFCYVPALGTLTSASPIPIPGEADNAVIAWTVAFARAKEQESRAPDDAWLTIYATEKQHLLQSLGLRQYQEPTFSAAVFAEYW